MESKVGVALTNCFFCGEGDRIVMNRVLTKSLADKVEAMHGCVVDMTPCSKCEQYMKQGILFISVSDDSEAEIRDAEYNKRIPNPYRTGGWVVLKEEAVRRIFSGAMTERVLRCRWAFVPDTVWKTIGLELPDQGAEHADS